MNWLLVSFVSISALFALALGFKAKTKKRFCAICAGVVLTWVGLFLLWKAGIYSGNKTIIALLMGQSVTGVYYLMEAKFERLAGLFRLPLLLTLTLAAYLLLTGTEGVKNVFVFLAALWIVFVVVYAGKRHPKIGVLFKQIIECCKNW